MPSEQHEKLNIVASRWAKRQGFPVVATNVVAFGSRERADVVAFRHSTSMVIESKVSRSDFLADKEKPERTMGGLGVYRFYAVPMGLVTIEDVPHGWGLLVVQGNKVMNVHKPTGNAWPPLGAGSDDWVNFQNAPDLEAERAVLFSIARRLSNTNGARHE